MKTRTGKKVKRLLISHVDLDGIGAVLLAQILSLKKPELEYTKYLCVNYGFETEEKLWQEILSYDIVHITDISVSEEKHKELIDNCQEVLLFDHHDSSEVLKKFPNTFHDTTRCGTKIYFQEYFQKQFPRTSSILNHFVELVNTYDTWREENDLWDEACNLNRVLMGLTNWHESDAFNAASEFFTKYHLKLSRLTEWRWLAGEQKVIDRAVNLENLRYTEAIDSLSIRKDYKGDIFGIICIGSKISLVCARVLKEITELRYLIVLNTYRENEGRISIRSRDLTFDCTLVHPFNGHFSASGGELTVEEFQEMKTNEDLCFKRKEDFVENEGPFINGIITK